MNHSINVVIICENKIYYNRVHTLLQTTKCYILPNKNTSQNINPVKILLQRQKQFKNKKILNNIIY